MNIPNQLTIARLILTLIFVGVMSYDIPYQAVIGLTLFAIASITDYLDGMIARKYNLITNFGKLMDPLVDKILMCSTFVVFTAMGLLPPWYVAVILAREFLITGLRLLATSEGKVLAADQLGKWKTVSQIALAIFFLIGMATEWVLFSKNGAISIILMTLALALTVVSGCSYLWKNRELLR